MVRSPRFEPGSSAWQADVLDQTRLRPHIHGFGWTTTAGDVNTVFSPAEVVLPL